MKKFELIDFLKGYSIFNIVLYHFFKEVPLGPAMSKVINFGGTGIHTFLMLSGFGLYLSFRDKPLGFGPFIKRRLSKVYIPYIIVVTVSALLALIIPIYETSWYAYLGHVFQYKMFDSKIIGSYGGQYWFISTIIQFYLIFHLLAWFKRKSNNAVYVITGIIISISYTFIVLYAGKQYLTAYNRFFLQYLWEFMLGMVLAEMVKTGQFYTLTKRINNFHILLIGVAGMAVFVLLAVKFGMAGVLLNDIPALIGYTCLAIFLYNLKIKPINQFFLYTGEISYSLFLVHILMVRLVFYFMAEYWGMTFTWEYIIIPLVMSFIASHFYNKFVAATYKWLKI